MKRTTSTSKRANESTIYPVFPNEILDLISKSVWEQATTLNNLLSWHSVSKHFWEEYLNFDEDKLLLFAEEKRKKNELLMKRLFRVEFRHNILVFTDFEMILQICKIIKEKIVSLVENKFYESSNSDPATEIYNMNKWEKWKGMKFEDGVLTKHSKELFIAITPRIVFRYGWQLIFNDSETAIDPATKKSSNVLLFYPFTSPIKTKSHCYIGDCSNLAMDKLMKIHR
jgi:hypothetical protein